MVLKCVCLFPECFLHCGCLGEFIYLSSFWGSRIYRAQGFRGTIGLVYKFLHALDMTMTWHVFDPKFSAPLRHAHTVCLNLTAYCYLLHANFQRIWAAPHHIALCLPLGCVTLFMTYQCWVCRFPWQLHNKQSSTGQDNYARPKPPELHISEPFDWTKDYLHEQAKSWSIFLRRSQQSDLMLSPKCVKVWILSVLPLEIIELHELWWYRAKNRGATTYEVN